MRTLHSLRPPPSKSLLKLLMSSVLRQSLAALSQLESLLSSRGQSALFNLLVPCRLTDVVWGSQRSYIDIQKVCTK